MNPRIAGKQGIGGRLRMAGRGLRDLRRFLADPLTPAAARASIVTRLDNRDELLIDLVRDAVYGHLNSPYLPLLRHAGCEFGDFVRLVRSEGAETALNQLATEGVYVSVEEFKGRVPIVRGGLTVKVGAGDFDNPHLAPHIESQTGGGRGPGTRVAYELGFLAESWATHLAIGFEALGMDNRVPYGMWLPTRPGAGPVVLLAHTKCGFPPTQWFSPLTPHGFRPSMWNRLSAHGLLGLGRLYGVGWPRPEYVALGDAGRVALWIHTQLQREGGCWFNSYTGTAVRVCQAAVRAGLDLSGATFLFGGEPLTEAKHAAVIRAGVTRQLVMYGSMDAGYLGLSCFHGQRCDEVHLFDDAFAFIERTRQVAHAGVSVKALLASSLLPMAPKVLLNVEIGDFGVLSRRPCGCVWEQMGLTRHLHTIRSFDKLTSEGMTFVGTDFVRVLEEVLPEQFGGGPGDYQMIEEEDQTGRTRVSIVVRPEIGHIDQKRLIQTVLSALSQGQDSHRMMARIWSESGTLRVLREQPFVTTAGKVLPLHIRGAPPGQRP
ncbi:MAG: hypothetical protein P1P84_18445 [Deferrisomatales bacterium]|nr:hypothetical protein [Deferrisomatales bacterium]